MSEGDRHDGAIEVVDGTEELAHAQGAGPLWGESWYFEWSTHDAAVGGFTRVAYVPNECRALFWLHLVLPDGIVAVCDHDVELPKTPKGVHLRAEALWCDYVPEEPLRRWGLAVESFGLHFPDGREMLDSDRGRRLPVGIDLEFEGRGAPVFESPAAPEAGAPTTRYQQVGSWQGELLVGREILPFEGWGAREHAWGVRDWWATPWVRVTAQCTDAAGALRLALTASRPTAGGPDATRGDRWRGGEGDARGERRGVGTGVAWHGGGAHRVTGFTAQARLADRSWPDAITLVLDDDSGARHVIEGETVDAAVIGLAARDGRHSRVVRALMQFRYTGAGGPASGGGFVEFNEPFQRSFVPPEESR